MSKNNHVTFRDLYDLVSDRFDKLEEHLQDHRKNEYVPLKEKVDKMWITLTLIGSVAMFLANLAWAVVRDTVYAKFN